MENAKQTFTELLKEEKHITEFREILSDKKGIKVTNEEVTEALKQLVTSSSELTTMVGANCKKDSTTGIIISAIKSVWSMFTICGELPGDMPVKPVPEPTPTPTPKPKPTPKPDK